MHSQSHHVVLRCTHTNDHHHGNSHSCMCCYFPLKCKYVDVFLIINHHSYSIIFAHVPRELQKYPLGYKYPGLGITDLNIPAVKCPCFSVRMFWQRKLPQTLHENILTSCMYANSVTDDSCSIFL